MASGIDWFRWHHGSVTDPKFGLVARRSGASLPDVLAVWAYILERASASEDRGAFGEIDCEAVDCLFNFPDTETRTADILKAMAGRDLVSDGRVVAWERRQPKREREGDSSAERTRDYRARKAAASQTEPSDDESSHVTPCDATRRQETPREEESRGDTSPSLRSVEGAPKRAARKCPKAFQLTEELTQWAKGRYPAVDAPAEFEKFTDHTFRNPITDWAGAFRNWIRKADEMRSERPGPVGPATAEQADAAASRAAASTKAMLDARDSIPLASPQSVRNALSKLSPELRAKVRTAA